MRILSYASSCLVVIAAMGCDPAAPPGSDAGSDVGAPVGLEDGYCQPLAERVCDEAADCGCGAVLPGGAIDRAACIAQWTTQCLEAWGPFVDAGAVFDAAAAADCVRAIDERTPRCARPDALVAFALCEPILVDPADLGESCASPWCAGGDGVCDSSSRTCGPRLGAGAACGDMFSCEVGLACVGGSCAAPADAGATCTDDTGCAPPLRCVLGTCAALGAAGASCVDDTTCGYHLACDGGTCTARPTCADGACGHGSVCGGARTCGARLGAGEPCTETRQCAATLFCAAGTCTARPASGEPCGDGTTCADGLGCDGTGNCAALPTEGMPCALGEMGPFLCADGLGCDDTGTCGALPTEGETCTLDNRCAGDLGCDFSPAGSLCIVRRGEGGSCESDRSCADGFHCGGAGTCTADLPSGSPCSVGNECAGVCGPDASGAFVCRDAPLAGDPCLFSDECPDTTACLAASPVCIAPICNEL